jgi:pimeloyl-ACP methyl ester carboxylesterase
MRAIDEPRRRGRGALLALLACSAIGLLAAGAVVATRGLDASRTADRRRAAAELRLARTRAPLRQAVADQAAIRGSVAPFADAARTATDATARVVDLEQVLVERLTKLQAAGQAQDIPTYNRIVDEMNAATDDFVGAFTELDPPLADFSRAFDNLPTLRCNAPVSHHFAWTRYGDSGLECARLLVPLDYAAPRGEQIQITVVRRPADDPSARIGPLLMNPGGPGFSGIAFLRQATLTLPSELLRRFDLVTFDPRGVGRSTPVDCADNLDPLFGADLTAPSLAARTSAVDTIEHLIQGCARRSGALLAHVDTTSATRDVDRIRAALHVDRLSYLGFSYGTYLGALYADLYPQHVRAVVLDGAIHPDRTRSGAANTDTSPFAAALDAALTRCADDRSCPFARGRDRIAAFDELMSRLVTAPLDTGGRRFGRTQAELGVVSGLYRGASGWPELWNALARADVGDAAPLAALADRYTGRRANGSYSNEMEAHYAINCVDLGGRFTPREARNAVRAIGDSDKHFEAVGVLLALPCAFWPAAHVDPPPGGLDAKGAPAILVIGNEGDPATPIEGAEALAKTLDSGTLLRWAGTGHTALGRGSACIDDAVVAYLVNLTPPPDGTTCPAT